MTANEASDIVLQRYLRSPQRLSMYWSRIITLCIIDTSIQPATTIDDFRNLSLLEIPALAGRSDMAGPEMDH